MAHSNDPERTAGSIHLVNDSKPPHAILPQTGKLSDQQRANLGITRECTNRLLDALLHIRRKTANDFGNVRRDVRR